MAVFDQGISPVLVIFGHFGRPENGRFWSKMIKQLGFVPWSTGFECAHAQRSNIVSAIFSRTCACTVVRMCDLRRFLCDSQSSQDTLCFDKLCALDPTEDAMTLSQDYV